MNFTTAGQWPRHTDYRQRKDTSVSTLLAKSRPISTRTSSFDRLNNIYLCWSNRMHNRDIQRIPFGVRVTQYVNLLILLVLWTNFNSIRLCFVPIRLCLFLVSLALSLSLSFFSFLLLYTHIYDVILFFYLSLSLYFTKSISLLLTCKNKSKRWYEIFPFKASVFEKIGFEYCFICNIIYNIFKLD